MRQGRVGNRWDEWSHEIRPTGPLRLSKSAPPWQTSTSQGSDGMRWGSQLRTTDHFELDPTAEGTPSVLVFSGSSEARRS